MECSVAEKAIDGQAGGRGLGSGVCAERRHKARRPAVGATLAPPIERRTGEASVIVAADGLTASDAVSCQLNLRAHPRPIAGYLGESARTQSSKLSIRRTGQHPADMGVGIGNGRSGPSGRSTSVATTDVRFPRPQYLRWAPLAAEPTRPCYTDRTVMRAFPLSARNQRGLRSGSGPTERRSALLGL